MRIEEQRPLVHILRRMRSYDYCGKGDLPKRKESHVLEAGSAIEKIQDCHIGNYMEGYLTRGNIFLINIVSTAAANPRCCFFAFIPEWP